MISRKVDQQKVAPSEEKPSNHLNDLRNCYYAGAKNGLALFYCKSSESFFQRLSCLLKRHCQDEEKNTNDNMAITSASRKRNP